MPCTLRNRVRRLVLIVIGCVGLALVPAPAAAQLSKQEIDKINGLVAKAQAEQRKEQLDRVLKRLEDKKDISFQYVGMLVLRNMQLPPEEGIPTYAHLLANHSEAVQADALLGLADYGVKAEALGPKILAMFQDKQKSPYVTQVAALALARIGYADDKAIDALIGQLQGKHTLLAVKVDVAEALGLYGPKAKKAVPVLRGLLQDPATVLQYEAFRSAGQILALPPPAAAQLLSLTAIDDQTEDGGYAIYRALQQAGPKAATAVPALLKTDLEKLPAYRRCMVLQTLGLIGGAEPTAIAALLANVAAPDPFIAKQAELALDHLDPRNDATVAVLVRGLGLDSQKARFAAARALTKFGTRASAATDALVTALKGIDEHTDLELIGAYLEVLRKIGPPAGKASTVILALLPERSRIYKNRPIPGHILDLRAFMVITLADIGAAPQALPYILEHLAHSDPDMVYPFAAGAYAAGVLGPAAKDAVPLLLPALTQARFNTPLSMAKPFATIGAGAAATSARVEAIRALARIGPAAKDAIPLLQKLAAQKIRARMAGPRYDEEARQALKILSAK